MGESQKLKSNPISNNSQVNLFNRYSKKDRTDSIINPPLNQGLFSNNSNVHNMSKIKTEISEEPNQAPLEMSNDQKEWENILRKFRLWRPNRV